jgi:hypothetical protein
MGQTKSKDPIEKMMGEGYIKSMKNMIKETMPAPVSRYQGLVLGKKKEDVMLIDTQTGDLYELMGVSDETIWRKYRWHGQDFIKWKGLEKNKYGVE